MPCCSNVSSSAYISRRPSTIRPTAGTSGWRVAAILHVEVVDDLPDARDRRVRDIETLRQCFERARRTVMTELTGIHVERHVRIGRPFDEAERRLRVDEPANQPRRRHPIDAGPGPGHPAPAAECRRRTRSTRSWAAGSEAPARGVPAFRSPPPRILPRRGKKSICRIRVNRSRRRSERAGPFRRRRPRDAGRLSPGDAAHSRSASRFSLDNRLHAPAGTLHQIVATASVERVRRKHRRLSRPTRRFRSESIRSPRGTVRCSAARTRSFASARRRSAAGGARSSRGRSTAASAADARGAASAGDPCN